jgi:peptide/nickel transport system substrate-binding protein
MLTGGLDAIRNISPDNAKSLGQQPNLTVANPPSGDEVYITLDAAGRSSSKVMTDQRVRKALMMAINRDELIKHIIPGHGTAVKLNSICFDWTVDCAMSTTPPAYDPEGAKKLLTEAGFPNGFDLEFNVHEPIREIGEAIAGELRKVGIRASVAPLPLAVYVKKRGEGEFTAFNGFYPTGAQPDAGNLYDFFFGADRDYYQDATIQELGKKAMVEYDQSKRTALYKQMVDRVNTMNYILPVASLPTAYAMTKEVKVMPDAFSFAGVYLNDLAWDNYNGK